MAEEHVVPQYTGFIAKDGLRGRRASPHARPGTHSGWPFDRRRRVGLIRLPSRRGRRGFFCCIAY